MSVIVTGMDMPKTCKECVFSRYILGEWFCRTTTELDADGTELWESVGKDGNLNRADFCPLIPVPPHGRLIDADDYAAEMKERQADAMLWKEKAARNNDMTTFARGDQAMRTFSEAKLTLDNMETIVEAEGGRRRMMTRPELIRALRRMKAETGPLVCLGCGHEHNCDIQGCAIIRAAAEELERIEVQPVRRGRWIVHMSEVFPADSTIECDQCHEVQSAFISDSFCPNCGADMRGGDAE